MQKNSITNKITPCCLLPFSVVYWWVSNLTLNSEANRQFIISKISQNGSISIDAWKILINSGSLEADSPMTKSQFLAWFDCERQPSCEQFKIIIESFKISNFNPLDEYGIGWTEVSSYENYGEKVIKKITNYVGGIGSIPAELSSNINKYYASDGGFTVNKDLATDFKSFGGVEVSEEFDPTTETKAQGGKQISERYDNLLKISESFLDGEIVEELIPMPHAGETPNQYITPELQANSLTGYGWGYIPISELATFEQLRLVGAEGASPLFLAKIVGGATINLMVGDLNQDFKIDIDFNASQYLYSRSPNMKFYKTKLDGITKPDAIKKYIDDKAKGFARKSECVFYPEDYGAIALDPRHPDDGKDCTNAFNLMFVDMFTNYPTINSYRVVMGGVYRIGGAPIYNNGQINIPFSANLDWNFKSVYFEGLTRPSLTDRGNNNMLNPLLGSGFYSSYIYTGNDYRHVIKIGAGSNFGLRVGHVFMDNISVYIKTHNSNNESIANNMSGFDFTYLSTFAFTDIYTVTTTAGLNTLQPAINSIGLLMPKFDNMASVYGNSLKIMGFGIGSILTEHLNLNHLIAVFNKDGVQIQNTYPINIGNATLEHNLCHVRMYPNSAVNFGVFQTEDFNDPQYWFNRTGNMIKGVATSRVTIGQTMSHVWGGGVIPLTYDSEIKLRYLMDESGNSKLN